ncbi:MAG: PorV/PorQ family protein [Bacteroidetes bacterium]|nr:PorV/PorQ family protein [Bacteroidota bacterium]
MKNKQHTILASTALTACLMLATTVFAGNPDRAGSAGAGQLLINPWAASNGMAGTDMAITNGLEGTFLNAAGLAFINQNELRFANTQYLSGSGISLNAIGFGTAVGDGGVLGLTVMTMGFGDIPITTEDLPEGGIGTFSPSFSNIGVTYSKAFSNSIYGGITMRVVSEAISNVRSSGVCFDAGIRYVSGDRLNFGIALRNVGAPMRFEGDGLTVTATPQGTATSLTMLQRSERYELPSLVNIGFGYDVYQSEMLNATLTGQFISNSFTKDQFGGGLQFSYNDRFEVRAGYLWEDGLGGDETITTAFTGPAAGFSLKLPASTDGAILGIDYGFRTTNPFNGNHSIGIHLSI